MLSSKATKWRPVLSALPVGVLTLDPKPHGVPGFEYVMFDGAIMVVNTLPRPESEGGKGWRAIIGDREGEYVGQTVLEGERPVFPFDPKAPDRIVPETPEEFRLRAIIVALASGYTLAETE
jgi:hypothetical protein